MDTYTQSVSGAVVGPAKSPERQLRTIAEKRQIVEETMVEGASVARIARAHGVNANQVFYYSRSGVRSHSARLGSREKA
jgi:transposase-like protein